VVRIDLVTESLNVGTMVALFSVLEPDCLALHVLPTTYDLAINLKTSARLATVSATLQNASRRQ
jgi:hypothetical protein